MLRRHPIALAASVLLVAVWVVVLCNPGWDTGYKTSAMELVLPIGIIAIWGLTEDPAKTRAERLLLSLCALGVVAVAVIVVLALIGRL